MNRLSYSMPDPFFNPLDLVEALVADREWSHERISQDEVAVEVAGTWCNYRLWFVWQETTGTLQFTCALDCKTAEPNYALVYPLLAKVNERIWLGHFDMSTDEGSIAFRHGMLVRGGFVIQQLEDMVDIGIAECERFYPVLQSVLWGNKNCEEALAAALFETVGEA